MHTHCIFFFYLHNFTLSFNVFYFCFLLYLWVILTVRIRLIRHFNNGQGRSYRIGRYKWYNNSIYSVSRIQLSFADRLRPTLFRTCHTDVLRILIGLPLPISLTIPLDSMDVFIKHYKPNKRLRTGTRKTNDF